MTRFSLHRGTAAGVSYRYLLSEVKRDQTGIGVLTVLHHRIGLIVAQVSA